MVYQLLSRTIKHIFGNNVNAIPNNYRLVQHTSSGVVENLNKGKFPYVKYLVIVVGGAIIFSFIYQAYKWTIQVPICPNFDRNQNININNVLTCTALVRNLDKQCSGNNPMKKVGAATGINFKLIRKESSTQIRLNDNDIIGRNIFDKTYFYDYIQTLADLIIKLDEIHLRPLLTNAIGYDIYVCSECHSSITRQMISCTSYLNEAGLEGHAVDMSEIQSQKK